LPQSVSYFGGTQRITACRKQSQVSGIAYQPHHE
jgi:hypothetical protein